MAGASGGTVIFFDIKGNVYEIGDAGESWKGTAAGTGVGNDMMIHTAVSREGTFAYAAMT